MKSKIFRNIFFTSVVLLVCCTLLITAFMYNSFTRESIEEVKTESAYLLAGYEKNGMEYAQATAMAGPNRITVIAADGNVIFDSNNDESTMEIHKDRPEIKSAFERGSGESVRNSETSGKRTYYYALLASDGNVVRVAATMMDMTKVISETGLLAVFTLAVATAIAFFISKKSTNNIIKPINDIDPVNPRRETAYEELSPLLSRMEHQNKKIEQQISQLKEARSEFTEITKRMSEALVIFSHEGKVLSANRSAKLLFDTEEMNGKDFFRLSLDTDYTECVKAALNGKASTVKLTKDSLIYRLTLSPVMGDRGYGALLFADDITAEEKAEELRHQFSANVSHELKTPLTTIMGTAELIQTGIAHAQDCPKLAEKIHKESKRLLLLIEDIIKLSRMDEGAKIGEMTQCELLAMADEVADSLFAKAESAGVTLQVKGIRKIIKGIPTLLNEMLYNLCDNAIKYNNKGGSATITVTEIGEKPAVIVSDNGIGIPKQDQEHIFERFYRVDKSRSKETGGTGLGLSIVKHTAQIHGAELKVESELDKGTSITVIFNNI